jgi:hypothetical protein
MRSKPAKARRLLHAIPSDEDEPKACELEERAVIKKVLPD